LVSASAILVFAAQQDPVPESLVSLEALPVVVGAGVTADSCSYLKAPAEFEISPEIRYARRSESTGEFAMYMRAATTAGPVLDAAAVPRKTFIDEHIFNRMDAAGIRSAPLATDEEYIRRAMLDLSGRIPSAENIESFLADTNPSKRDLLVDSLIGTPEFVDKWTMFFGDLFKVNANASNVNRFIPGRDAFYLYIRAAIAANKPYDQMARELIAGTGDSFVDGNANWAVGNIVPMGPAQDTYDGHAVNLAGMFLGINAVDCLLCHDGARHLDEVNLWGARQTRQNMWGLSAYFAQTRMQRQVISVTPNLAKFMVLDAVGEYNLNTTTGNRSPRQPIGGVNRISPKNPFSADPDAGIAPGETRRQAIARQITADPQFSRAAVNYIWEKFMVEAFVTPSNSFDPARLDPAAPLPPGWTLQPTNPELLQTLALWFQQNRYDLRALMSLIAKSNAYQLSAVYPGTWDASYVPYYARRYVRRLDAEELHDAVIQATGILPNPAYAFDNLPSVQWAMQLPDTREPRRNAGAGGGFLNQFGRGDRDLNPRRYDGSLSQALAMMNNAFVMGRIHQANAGSRVATLLAQYSDPPAIVYQLFLSTLSRRPTVEELAMFVPTFEQHGNRVAAENLQWVLLNKLDFIFNY
jgi:hypothetical protein